MYSAELKMSVPKYCYFCGKWFLSMKDIAILEEHVFCPNCGYEIQGSVLEVQEESFEDMDYDNRR